MSSKARIRNLLSSQRIADITHYTEIKGQGWSRMQAFRLASQFVRNPLLLLYEEGTTFNSPKFYMTLTLFEKTKL